MTLYECSKCHNAHPSSLALHEHCRSNKDHIYCIICKRLFGNAEGLRLHLQTSKAHQFDYVLKGDCDLDVKLKTGDIVIVNTVNNTKAYCATCDMNFSSKYSLNHHLYSSTSHNWCFLCSCDFKNRKALSKHLKVHAHDSRSQWAPTTAQKNMSQSPHPLHWDWTDQLAEIRTSPQIAISRRVECSSVPIFDIDYSTGIDAFNGPD